jgi:hypothetical protein
MSFVVGSYSRLPQSPGYVPLTMQEMAYAPSIMRDRYDKTQAQIGEATSALEDWKATSSDIDFVQSQIDPLAQSLDAISQELASTGQVSPQQLRNITKATTDWKRMKTTGVVAIAESKLQKIQEYNKHFDEVFEKNPALAQAAKATIISQPMGKDEEGNIIGTGVDALNAVKHYTKEEQVELTNKFLSNLGYMDVKTIDNNVVTIPITSQGDFAALLQNETISTKEKGRIIKGLLDGLGDDIPQSMLQEMMLKGEAVGMDKEGNVIINPDYANLLENKHFEVDANGYLKLDEPISPYGRLIAGQAGIKQAYKINESNTRLTAFGGGSGKDNEDGPRAVIQGSRISTETISPFAGSVLDPNKKGTLAKTAAQLQAEENVLKRQGYKRDESGNWLYPEGGLVSPFDYPHILNKLKEDVNKEKDIISNPETNKELAEFISKDHRLIEYREKHGAAKTLDLINKWYSNLSQSYGSIIDVGEAKRKSIENLYSKNIHNHVIVDGNNNILTFDAFAKDTLGKSQEESLKDGYNFIGPRNVPGKGVMFEFGFTDSKDNKVSAFVEPPEDVNVPTQMISAEIDNAILAMHETKLPYARVTDDNGNPVADTTNYIDGEIIPIYWTVVPNWETGEAMMYGVTDPSINPYHYIGTPQEKDTTKVIIQPLSAIKARENKYAADRIQKVNWK